MDRSHSAGILCIILVTATLASVERPQAAETKPADPVPVNTVTAVIADVPKIIAGIGTVSPLQSVIVRPRIGGEVMSISFHEGDTVHAGDVLAQIDPRELDASLKSAEAKKQQDAVQVAVAQADVERYNVLAEKDVVSKQTLDQKVSTLKQLQAAVASDEAALANARNQLAFATVTAPISGQTGFKSIDVGGLAVVGSTEIVTITQLDPIGVVFVAPGDRFEEIREALKADIAEVEAWSTDGSHLLARGKLTLMDNAVDSANGSIRLRAAFDNKSGKLWPGLPVATRLTVSVRHGVTVPDKALSRGLQGTYAFVLQADGTVKRRPVKAAFVTSGQAAILDGINAGDRVVTDGTSRINDGMRVTATDKSNETASALPEPTP